MKTKGFIHIYTGNGKGKTTAAMGLAIRAVGAEKSVFIGQFVKGMHYAELDSLKRFPEITIKQYGLDCFIVNKPTEKDIELARNGLNEVRNIILNNQYDIVILDEIFIAIYYQLIPTIEVINLMKQKPEPIELILTGRYAPKELYEYADLITEMNEIKHYYHKGIQARKGIEF